jgi:hypothetical protein
LNKNELTALTLKDSKLEAKEITFEQDDYKGAQEIAGAIFETNSTYPHPINFECLMYIAYFEILQS